ncbi:MAG TPA: autotransporter outer membrane beta-barrel domain-containing protein, partial [Rhodanobacteraceae bacterium]|nr:autotransporter outer membrane beta-barrel domain-containing protein [Rhodanobacteraceae bacterium]
NRMDERGSGKDRSVWVNGYGMSGSLDSDGNTSGADVRMHGVAIGVDTWVGDHWLIGASIGKLSVHGDFAPGDRGQSDLKSLSVYTRVRGDHLFVDGVLSHDWDDNKVARRIQIGDLTRQARANYGSHGTAVHLEAGWTWSIGHQRLQPLLSFDHARQDNDHFIESGAGSLSLSGASHSTKQHLTGIGLRWFGAWQAGSWTLRPSVEARRLRQSLAPTSFPVAFVGAPDNGYAVRGASLPRYQNLFDLGLLARKGRLELYLDGSARTGGNADAASVNAGLRWHW